MSLLKVGVLGLLVLQTSCIVLILRYTRTVDTDKPRYLSSTVVVLAEIIKSTSCIFIILCQSGFRYGSFVNEMYYGMFSKPSETMKIAVPSGVYAIQNNLLFIALSYLDAGTYQVTYQLKILTTAGFSVLLLGRTLSLQQWIALLLLTIGVALVQFPAESSEINTISLNNRLFGLFILLVSCVSSGFAGVYFELLLKKSTLSLWIRNLQMAMFGTFFSSLTTIYSDWHEISQHGFFQGYNTSVVIVLLLQAYGGLLVAMAVKYTDNIIKGFATSLSIILSSAISHLVFQDLQFTLLFGTGTFIVLAATFLYGHRASSRKIK